MRRIFRNADAEQRDAADGSPAWKKARRESR